MLKSGRKKTRHIQTGLTGPVITLIGLLCSLPAVAGPDQEPDTINRGALLTATNSQLLESFQQQAIDQNYEVEWIGDSDRKHLHLRLRNLGTLESLLRHFSFVIEYPAEKTGIVTVILLDEFQGKPAIDDGNPQTPRPVLSIVEVPTSAGSPRGGANIGLTHGIEDRTFDVQSVGPEEAIEKLAHALGAKLPATREWAIDGLGEFGIRGHRSAVIALGQVLYSDPSPTLRRSAVQWLRSIGSDSSVVFVDVARQDESDIVRNAAGGG